MQALNIANSLQRLGEGSAKDFGLHSKAHRQTASPRRRFENDASHGQN